MLKHDADTDADTVVFDLLVHDPGLLHEIEHVDGLLVFLLHTELPLLEVL